MVRVTASAGYLPPFRLPTDRLRTQWGGGTGGVEAKAVQAIDDDAITLGLRAARSVLPPNPRIDVVVFATTTPPYHYGSTAPVLCDALGLPADVHTLELTESARAGTAAIRTATDSLSGDAQQALVVAAEAPTPAPDTDREGTVGAGAGALLLETEDDTDGIAVEATRTCSRPILEEWQAPAESERHLADARFRRDSGYVETTARALEAVLAAADWTPETVDGLVANQPEPGWADSAASAADVPTDRVAATDLVAEVGDLAAAAPLAALAALSADRGDRIVVCGYGSGVADALALTATADVAASPLPAESTTDLSYLDYLDHTNNLRDH